MPYDNGKKKHYTTKYFTEETRCRPICQMVLPRNQCQTYCTPRARATYNNTLKLSKSIVVAHIDSSQKSRAWSRKMPTPRDDPKKHYKTTLRWARTFYSTLLHTIRRDEQKIMAVQANKFSRRYSVNGSIGVPPTPKTYKLLTLLTNSTAVGWYLEYWLNGI